MHSQKINCDVESCKYNMDGSVCSLNSITVSNDATPAHEKSQTECASFKDGEY